MIFNVKLCHYIVFYTLKSARECVQTAFFVKTAAKLLLFFEMSKFFAIIFHFVSFFPIFGDCASREKRVILYPENER